jgi:hypothetical protein
LLGDRQDQQGPLLRLLAPLLLLLLSLRATLTNGWLLCRIAARRTAARLPSPLSSNPFRMQLVLILVLGGQMGLLVATWYLATMAVFDTVTPGLDGAPAF